MLMRPQDILIQIEFSPPVHCKHVRGLCHSRSTRKSKRLGLEILSVAEELLTSALSGQSSSIFIDADVCVYVGHRTQRSPDQKHYTAAFSFGQSSILTRTYREFHSRELSLRRTTGTWALDMLFKGQPGLFSWYE